MGKRSSAASALLSFTLCDSSRLLPGNIGLSAAWTVAPCRRAAWPRGLELGLNCAHSLPTGQIHRPFGGGADRPASYLSPPAPALNTLRMWFSIDKQVFLG
jgi:hypothetical protein